MIQSSLSTLYRSKRFLITKLSSSSPLRTAVRPSFSHGVILKVFQVLPTLLVGIVTILTSPSSFWINSLTTSGTNRMQCSHQRLFRSFAHLPLTSITTRRRATLGAWSRQIVSIKSNSGIGARTVKSFHCCYPIRNRSLQPETRLFSSTIDRIMNDERVNYPNHNPNSNDPKIPNLRGGSDDGNALSSYNDSNNDSANPALKHYTEYELWVRRLYATNLFHPVKLGLENMEKLHTAIGNPMDNNDNISVIHIAGTNGKGSVAMKIAKTLQYTGLKVGLFCSPHVSSFRERMQINDTYISEDEVVQLLPHIYELCKLYDIPATFFEITTLLAFQYFALHKVDVVVLETGLGGRLDATNVITKPALSIITSIGLEHTRILGDTIELIALEKGGIIKSNCPVLVGPNVPHETLRQCAQEKGASHYYTCEDILLQGSNDATSLFNNNNNNNHQVDYDYENSCIAKAAIHLLQQSHPHLFQQVRRSSSSTTTSSDMDDSSHTMDAIIDLGISHRPPCRFEIVQYQYRHDDNDSTSTNKEIPLIVILDVAHNPPAMEYLRYKLQATYPNHTFRIVVGMSSDKDLQLCSTLLKEIVQRNDMSRIHLVEAAHPRAAKLEAIWNADPELQQSATYDIHDRSITKQINIALTAIAENKAKEVKSNNNVQNDEILVICGSVFLMAEAREALGFDEPRDSPYIAELAGAGVRHNQENFGNRTLL